ncbi:uncharacterized protein FIBRA_06737 [Fibroporia radiculosa]|uniref:ABC transporter domain-containing protein n=1 Tax=Fibroporia radiculosa TaxID=599839 RepID=J4IBF2_9APHY|nr:uncharacterized protein FIBRA_06737 [Fibroporia radiculosa]CCM04556.1 predicted protein [Fibroporia radiculosa]
MHSTTLSGEKADSDSEQVSKHVSKRDQNITSRQLGVAFQDLRVVGVGARSSFQQTIASAFNPLVIYNSLISIRNPPLRDILSGFQGAVFPGEMLLVLGRPGSGCSTFLKTLANQHAEYRSVEGQLHYDSFTPKDIAQLYKGDVTYCQEDDVHFPTLTLFETLSFASKTRAPQCLPENQSRQQFADSQVNTLLSIFGLEHARNTIVGDAMLRGVSGGEKKRLSLAEVLACRGTIGCWDNSTRGLDSSTALEFLRALRATTDSTRVTTIVSLYQAGQPLYDLFDKVCVISEGKMVYFGPAAEASQYFVDMGYQPYNRQTTPDFLVSVTDPKGRKIIPGHESSVPRTASEMAAYFSSSTQGELNRASIEEFCAKRVGNEVMRSEYRASALLEHSQYASTASPYIISIPMQVRAAMLRRVQIMKGSIAVIIIDLCAQVFQAIIMGTMFFHLEEATSEFFSRGGILFFALFFGAVSALAEIPGLFAQRRIVLRQQKAAMYHPFIESLSYALVDIPITFIIQSLFSIVIYFLVDLQRTAAQFFIFLLFVFMMTLCMKTLFRAIAATVGSQVAAQSIAGMTIVVAILYAGYTIPIPSMIGGLKWLSYLNACCSPRLPLALMLNEFHTINGMCSSLVPQGPGYENVSLANQVCTTIGSVPGEAYVSGSTFLKLSFGYEYHNLWKNFGIVCTFCLGFLAIYLVTTEVNSAAAFETSVMLFKRGSNVTVEATPSDEEKAGDRSHSMSAPSLGAASDDASPDLPSEKNEKHEIADIVPTTTDIFSWQHIYYTVPISGGDSRQLLDDVSGFVAPGKLTALMGESGAGKTTLLNVLADRTSIGVVRGDRFVNGQPLPADFQAQTGYCQQMDTHLGRASVREALLFSANLRQPQSVPVTEKEAYVEKCLEMCGLEAFADAIVGSLGVEQRKRVTIGVELAAKPKLLLFLDEPTSGLDSQSAWAVMTFLRDLAASGQAILCTIHQPSAELFQLFDRLLLLRKGGQTVYFDEIGDRASTLLNYFEKNGAPPCDPDANPAEYMLDVIGAGATATTSIDWAAVWTHSSEAQKLQREIERIHTEGLERPVAQSDVRSEFTTSWGHQFVILLHRSFQNYWRDPVSVFAKVTLNIATGLLIGFSFFHTKDDVQGSQNKLFSIFMAIMCSIPLGQMVQPIFVDVRDVYEIRERPSRMYSWTALVASQILSEIPWNIFGSSLFFVCWYWTVGYETSRAGYTYLMYGVIFPVYYVTIGQLFAAMSPNALIASLLFSVMFTFVFIFDGIMQPFSQLGWWRWMYRVSPFTYLVEAIGRQDITCASQELVTLNPIPGSTCVAYLESFIDTVGGYLVNPDATNACLYCPYRTTDQYMLNAFNIKYSLHWRDTGIVLGTIAFNIFAIYLLTYIFRIHTGGWLKWKTGAGAKKQEM